MTALLAIIGSAAVLLSAIWLAGLRGSLWTMIAAAVTFGCAGYLFQGRPDLPGAPRDRQARAIPMSLTGARQAFLGQFDYSDNWLTIADALESRGKPDEAARLLAAQVQRHPGEFKLWIGLGNALSDHAQTLSPAARLSFQRAAELAPGNPAPPFFLGLAEARSGKPEEARRLWTAILKDAPADASWRPMVEQGLTAIGGDVQSPPTAKN